MQTEQDKPGHDIRTQYFGVTDAFFILIALLVAIIVTHLGYAALHEGQNTEISKAHGEQIAAWLEQHGKARAAGKAGTLPACDAKRAHWSDCRAALFAGDGPFAGMANVISPQGKLVSPVCDRKEPASHGAILFEKGSAKGAPDGSLTYAPLADDEALGTPLPIRVTVCGRGYLPLHIKKVNF